MVSTYNALLAFKSASAAFFNFYYFLMTPPATLIAASLALIKFLSYPIYAVKSLISAANLARVALEVALYYAI